MCVCVYLRACIHAIAFLCASTCAQVYVRVGRPEKERTYSTP